jgi:hypothetical protein
MTRGNFRSEPKMRYTRGTTIARARSFMEMSHLPSRELPTGFYWLVAPAPSRGGLAGMPLPTEEFLRSFAGLGIGLVVSLVERSAMNYQAPPGLRLAHLPIDDGRAPGDAQLHLVARLCAYIHHFRLQPRKPRSVAVHCLGGQGRTGLMLICYRSYLAAVHPGDSDAEEPHKTAEQIALDLYRAYGYWPRSPNPHQIRWAAMFYSRMRQQANPAWEVAAANEVGWQRRDAHASDGIDGPALSVFTCEHCGGVATHHTPALRSPMWCPTCGRATGGSGG